MIKRKAIAELMDGFKITHCSWTDNTYLKIVDGEVKLFNGDDESGYGHYYGHYNELNSCLNNDGWFVIRHKLEKCTITEAITAMENGKEVIYSNVKYRIKDNEFEYYNVINGWLPDISKFYYFLDDKWEMDKVYVES